MLQPLESLRARFVAGGIQLSVSASCLCVCSTCYFPWHACTLNAEEWRRDTRALTHQEATVKEPPSRRAQMRKKEVGDCNVLSSLSRALCRPRTCAVFVRDVACQEAAVVVYGAKFLGLHKALFLGQCDGVASSYNIEPLPDTAGKETKRSRCRRSTQASAAKKTSGSTLQLPETSQALPQWLRLWRLSCMSWHHWRRRSSTPAMF